MNVFWNNLLRLYNQIFSFFNKRLIYILFGDKISSIEIISVETLVAE